MKPWSFTFWEGNLKLQTALFSMKQHFITKNHWIRHNLKPKSSTTKKEKNVIYHPKIHQRAHQNIFFFPCLAIALTISDVHNDPRTWTSVIMTNGYKNINGNIHMLRSEKVSLQYQAVMKHSIRHITCETAPPTLLGLLMHTTLPAWTTTSNQRLLASSQNPVKSNQTGNPKKSDSEASRD